MSGVIVLEILQGFRSDSDYAQAKERLSRLDTYSIFNSTLIERCAENYRFLRKQGITIRKTYDVIIATWCIDHQLPLLFTDRDFDPFVEYLGLVSVCSTDMK